MSNKGILRSKSYEFAVEIVKTSISIRDQFKEFDLSRQLLRSGTAIGALVREAEFGQSKADFSHKLSISLKEANETDYWLSLLKDTEFLNSSKYEHLSGTCQELIRMLVASIKTVKSH